MLQRVPRIAGLGQVQLEIAGLDALQQRVRLGVGILLARQKKDVKLEKKYLAMMAQYGETEVDRKSAGARLEALNQKK